jgi:hypothetical protein
MLDVLGIKNANKLIPMEDDQKPMDPVTENQNILMMKPIKAFSYQDHEAHITVHQAVMQDPKIMALLQNNPQAPAMQAAMMAHINEHLGYAYRLEIEKQLGMTLPPQKDASGEDLPMDPQVEVRLAPLLAQAAQQLLQQNQGEAQQKQAQQQAQDPLVQMQQQEIQIKQQEQQRKAAKDQADNQLAMQRLQLEQERIQSQNQTAAKQQQNDLLKTAAQQSLTKKQQMITAGVDVMKQISTQHNQEKKQIREHGHQRDQAIINAINNQQNKSPTKG